MQISTIGLDIAKRVFQAHGVDASGKAVLRRKLQRPEVLAFFEGLSPCLVGIEACGTAHHWAREIEALGHEVRLMPPSYVKPYVKRGKTDAADAEAICEAVTRPTLRFVPIKTADQQAVLMLHRTRDLLVRQRTMLVNALRGHMAELGVIAPQGISRVGDLLAALLGEDDAKVPKLARQALQGLAAELEALGNRVKEVEATILGLAQEQRSQPAADHHPRRRTHHRVGDRGEHHRPHSIPLRTAACGLDRARTQAALDRRQAATGRYLEAGRPVLAPVAGARCDRSHSTRSNQSHGRSRVAERAIGTAAGPACVCGAGQQDGTHHLGLAGEGRNIPRIAVGTGGSHVGHQGIPVRSRRG